MTKTDDAWEAPDEVILPDDAAKPRLNRPARVEAPDDVATFGDRVELFWGRHPDGNILTEVEQVIAGDVVIYTVRAFARKNGDSESPDSTAHATRSSADPDPVTAQFPQETAETSAISRALRNLGILATNRKPAAPVEAPVEKTANPLATARAKARLSQKGLAEQMRGQGFSWTQATVSKIERGTRALTADERTGLISMLILEP